MYALTLMDRLVWGECRAHGEIIPSIDQAHPLFTLLCLRCALNRIIPGARRWVDRCAKRRKKQIDQINTNI